ncbi:MAG: RNA polymerase sigma factor [Gemmatimonadaceae bacterium]
MTPATAAARPIPYGDTESLGAIFATHHRFVGHLARNILGDDDADDGVQEVFLRLSRKGVTYDGRSSLSTWLYRVTVNTCINMVRARSRRWRRLAPLSLSENAPAPERQLAWEMDLRDALSTLAPVDRDALLLHDWEGYRHSEIAHSLGIAEGTSKCRAFKARRELRRALAADY